MACLQLPDEERTAEVVTALGGVRSVEQLEAALAGLCVAEGERFSGLRRVVAAMPEALQARFWDRVLPSLSARLGALRGLFPDPVPLLIQGRAASVSLSKPQAAALLASMFLLCLPDQGESTGEPWPSVCMLGLLCSAEPQEMAKLRAVMHYFGRLSSDDGGAAVHAAAAAAAATAAAAAADASDGGGSGGDGGMSEDSACAKITFRRLVLPPLASPTVEESQAPMCSLRVLDEGHTIEEAAGCLQADFANAYLGGGVLCGGCVQEEIRFALCPELICGMALCAAMRDDEALLMTGAERYSDYEGYAFGLRWGGDHIDATPRMGKSGAGTPATCIVAFDATPYEEGGGRGADGPGRELRAQLQRPALLRELNKALAAFTPSREAEAQELLRWPFGDGGSTVVPEVVATGNWGCGAFGGDLEVKAVLQWLAASVAGRRCIEYYSFGEPGLADGLSKLAEALGKPLGAEQRAGAVGAATAAAAAAAEVGQAAASAVASDIATAGFVWRELLRYAGEMNAKKATAYCAGRTAGLFAHLISARKAANSLGKRVREDG